MSLNNVEKKHYSFDKNTVFKLSPKIKMNDFKLSEKIFRTKKIRPNKKSFYR